MEQEMELLKRYKKADFSERMYLFLQHRDMRNAFQAIEFKNSAAKGKSFAARSWISPGNSLNSFKRSPYT